MEGVSRALLVMLVAILTPTKIQRLGHGPEQGQNKGNQPPEEEPIFAGIPYMMHGSDFAGILTGCITEDARRYLSDRHLNPHAYRGCTKGRIRRCAGPSSTTWRTGGCRASCSVSGASAAT